MNLLLLIVLVGAAGLKAVRPAVTTRHLTALGLPRPALLARLVPAVEVAVGVALVVAPAWGATAALVLLAAFTAVVIDTVRSGRQVSCGCLGVLDRGRAVSWRTVARNGVLLAAAIVAVAVPASRWPSPDHRVVAAAALVVGPALVLAVVGSQLVALRHRLGRLWSVELAGEAVVAGRSPHSRPSLRPQPANPRPAPGRSTGRTLP